MYLIVQFSLRYLYKYLVHRFIPFNTQRGSYLCNLQYLSILGEDSIIAPNQLNSFMIVSRSTFISNNADASTLHIVLSSLYYYIGNVQNGYPILGQVGRNLSKYWTKSQYRKQFPYASSNSLSTQVDSLIRLIDQILDFR